MLLLGARGENDFKLVQMNLEKNLRKEIKKNGKGGTRCWANPAPLSAQRAARPAAPSPSLPRARRPPCPSQRRPRGGRTPARSAPRPATYTPLVGTPARAPRPFHPSCDPRPSPSSLRSRSTAAATPPQRHRRSSSAAHRRPLQCPNLDAETTRALAVVAVSSCERSTEVRSR